MPSYIIYSTKFELNQAKFDTALVSVTIKLKAIRYIFFVSQKEISRAESS